MSNRANKEKSNAIYCDFFKLISVSATGAAPYFAFSLRQRDAAPYFAFSLSTREKSPLLISRTA